MDTTNEPLVGIDKLASHFNYSVNHTRVLIQDMNIPHYRIGKGKFLFRLSEVESFLLNSSQEVNN